MTHMNGQTAFVRKFLQAILPQTTSTAVASATIRRHAQMFRIRIKLLVQVFVPTRNSNSCNISVKRLVLWVVQRSGDIGLPLAVGSTRASSDGFKVG